MTVYVCMWSDVYSNFNFVQKNTEEEVLKLMAELLMAGFYNVSVYKQIVKEKT